MTEDILLIAVDLDGTLLTSEGILGPKSAGALREAAHNGVRVVLASARPADIVQSICRILETKDPMICLNGAEVWGSPDGPVWAYHPIPQAVAQDIAELADRYQWELATTVGAVTYWRQRPGQTLGGDNPNRSIVARNSDAIVGDPTRILTWEVDAVEIIQSLCQSKFPDQCYTEIFYKADGDVEAIGVFALGADKGSALRLVLERLGLKPEQAMAIGDNINDLAMFSQVGVSVAMANAPSKVKAKASMVAPSNDDEGVAWALERCGVVE